uniref:Uncharacterized protein n=1 Tax=Siphoviridae sp. ctClL93 TaxID=2825381 RepID=A0A8S5VE01_9CAUD|nr:MAG TPA: hypothetical protein [Siphoviridae sp. ctClL93]
MEKKAMLSQPMGGRMSSKANCLNCGAPITGDVCEYCGTRYDTGITFHIVPPKRLLYDTLLLSRRIQQCSSSEIENLQTRLAREAANVSDIRAYKLTR